MTQRLNDLATQSQLEDAHLARTMSTGILNSVKKDDLRPYTARPSPQHVRKDMRKSENFFYQTINQSEVAFTPTVSSAKISINQLYATMPLNEKQKSMVNRASKHLFASATPMT